MTDWQIIADQISAAIHHPFEITHKTPRSGGSINSAWLVSGGGRNYFVKTNQAPLLEMFIAEGEGLAELTNAHNIRVPEPICWGIAGEQCFIAMEYIELDGRSQQSLLGEQLAALHGHTQAVFGWHRNNTIGSTHQPNETLPDWIEFWRQRRLGFQLERAAAKGFGGNLQRKGERLMTDMTALFSDYQPQASLLHGDLWGGNASTDSEGNPVIFDPATYYGDRETDLAMTELFGGFSRSFYDAYDAHWPIDPGYKIRKTFYNIYHLLNHANMFGGGYAQQAESSMDRVLAEL